MDEFDEATRVAVEHKRFLHREGISLYDFGMSVGRSFDCWDSAFVWMVRHWSTWHGNG